MAERTDTLTWINRGLFVLFTFAICVMQLLPLGMEPAGWAGPDLLLAATLVWVARKPGYLPVWLIAAIFLMADLLFLRPPGLWAGLVMILTEVIRRQHREFRNMPLFAEWGTIAVGIVLITLANRFVLVIVMAPKPPFGLSLMEMVATIAAYPVVVAIAHFGFRVSRAAPGETGRKGQLL